MQDAVLRHDIQNVAVILAGSRTGSSFLYNALASQGEYICPTGEETVFYRQAGLGIFKKNYDDSLDDPKNSEILDRIFHFMMRDIGLRAPTVLNITDLFAHFWSRLKIQWPEIDNTLEKVAFSSLEKAYSDSATPNDWASVYLRWIQLLQLQKFPVDSGFFSSNSEHPMDVPLIEEPPYVTPVAHIPLHKNLAQSNTLLLKTSTNVYRLPFLKALFPNARFRWIVLQRNPAATINALMDGWLSSAFHSHDVSQELVLKIRGYSSTIPEGHRYWKFDMPPGWRAWTTAPLEDVCAFQWFSAYQHIQKFLSTTTDPYLTVSYEQLLETANVEPQLQRILDFTSTAQKSFIDWKPQVPVATVHPPRPGKWKKRGDQILSALDRHPHILQLANTFAYNPNERQLWP